jgi:hypothetical protein
MKVWLIVLGLSLTGCNTLRKIPGIGGSGSTPPEQASIPDDYVIRGTTIADYQTIYLPTGSLTDDRQVVGKVKRPGEDWVNLRIDSTYWWASEFQVKKGPPSDAFTFRKKVVESGGYYSFPGPVAPTGTEYEIHSVKTVTEHSLY